MLPLGLLKNCTKNPILVEVKSGETFNGTLVSCDSWMNLNLVDVVCTAAGGDKFWRLSECHIKGFTVKYIRIPDEVLDQAREDNRKQRMQYAAEHRERNQQRGGYRREGRGGYARGGDRNTRGDERPRRGGGAYRGGSARRDDQ